MDAGGLFFGFFFLGLDGFRSANFMYSGWTPSEMIAGLLEAEKCVGDAKNDRNATVDTSAGVMWTVLKQSTSRTRETAPRAHLDTPTRHKTHEAPSSPPALSLCGLCGVLFLSLIG